MEFKLVIHLSDETRALLRSLVSAATEQDTNADRIAFVETLNSPGPDPAPAEKPKTERKPRTSKKTQEQEREPVPDPADDSTGVADSPDDDFLKMLGADEPEPVTMETIRELTSTKAKNGKRDEIKKIMAAFKLTKVSDLTDEQLPAFYKKISDL